MYPLSSLLLIFNIFSRTLKIHISISPDLLLVKEIVRLLDLNFWNNTAPYCHWFRMLEIFWRQTMDKRFNWWSSINYSSIFSYLTASWSLFFLRSFIYAISRCCIANTFPTPHWNNMKNDKHLITTIPYPQRKQLINVSNCSRLANSHANFRATQMKNYLAKLLHTTNQ